MYLLKQEFNMMEKKKKKKKVRAAHKQELAHEQPDHEVSWANRGCSWAVCSWAKLSCAHELLMLIKNFVRAPPWKTILAYYFSTLGGPAGALSASKLEIGQDRWKFLGKDRKRLWEGKRWEGTSWESVVRDIWFLLGWTLNEAPRRWRE